MMDSSKYTDAEKEYYEVQGQNVYEGNYQQLEDGLNNLITEPLDPLTPTKHYDQRSKPEVGY